jgi:sialate O-acetylesterase
MKTLLIRVLCLVLAFGVSTKIAGADVSIELSRPSDFEVFQRTDARTGEVIVEGRVAGGEKNVQPPGRLEVRFLGDVAPGKWEPFLTNPGVAKFRGVLKVPAGGWYQMELRLVDAGKNLAESRVEHVGVGEVWVVAGQSNSANYGEEKLRTSTGRVSARTADGKWQVCEDPQPGAGGRGGSFLPPLGDALANELGVPVGFVSVGVGGTSVREWLPRGIPVTILPSVTGRMVAVGKEQWESDGALFDSLAGTLKSLGKGGCRAVLWHQGESDANQADPTRTLPGPLYRANLGRVIGDSRLAAGWPVPWFVAQATYHVPGDEFSPEIRLAQRQIWEAGLAMEGPDTDALTGEMRERGGAGVHFSGAGQRAHATRWAGCVLPWVRGILDAGKSDRVDGPVRLAPAGVFSDRMVLQQERRVPVWGSGVPGREVVVEFGGQRVAGKPGPDGRWRVDLEPMEASSQPRVFSISDGVTRLDIRDVLVGEVWLVSGQSNMHWTLSHVVENAAAELDSAQVPEIRQFTVRKGGASAGPVFAEGGWHRANRQELLSGGTSGDSALGYFFARHLHGTLKVPVGIVNASVGGTPVEAWMKEGGLYRAMVEPAAPYALQGVLWYQGESNCLKGDGPQYTDKLRALIGDWRRAWNRADLPFFFVQIAPWLYSGRSSPQVVLTPESLPEFWMAQTAVLREPRTGMVVIGDTVTQLTNIHPANKQEVARRLALQALKRVYGKERGEVESPLFSAAVPQEGKLVVRFEGAESGLETRDGKDPAHLEVAGEDGVFHPAHARMENSSLRVWSENVLVPKRVRHCWREDAIPNLRNREGLPVAPFDSVKWPGGLGPRW